MHNSAVAVQHFNAFQNEIDLVCHGQTEILTMRHKPQSSVSYKTNTLLNPM